MAKLNEKALREKLLKDKRVIDEINRHLWIESEKRGYNIGFEQATQDWFENFSKSWMKYYMPTKGTPKKSASKKHNLEK